MHELKVSPDGFVNMLASLDKGLVVEELDRELVKAIQSITDFGGASTITLKIGIKKMANMETAVVIGYDIIVKHPKEDRRLSSMFVVGGCGLVEDFQEQQSLELKDSVTRIGSKLTAITEE